MLCQPTDPEKSKGTCQNTSNHLGYKDNQRDIYTNQKHCPPSLKSAKNIRNRLMTGTSSKSSS